MSSAACIQNLLSNEDCQKILNKSVEFPTQVQSFKITKFHENVAGFLGEHLSLVIQFKNNNKFLQKTYFLKTLPIFNVAQLDYVIEAGFFKKEILLYENLLNELLKYGNFGPKCYLTKEGLLVLDDLKAKGYKMLSRHLYLDEDHMISALKTLAYYHASTLIYEERKGFKLNQKFQQEIQEACFNFVEGQPRQKWMVSTTKCVTDLMKLASEDINIEKISKQFRNFVLEKLEFYLTPSKKYVNVMTHDDLWCNNLLFNDRKECLFVDFQLVRYTPPAIDFLVTLYLNLNCFHVENNLPKYVDIYYNFFVELLKKYGLDEEVLPKSEFQETLGVYRLAALAESIMYGTHVFISDKLSNDMMKDLTKFNEFSFINRSKYGVKEFSENSQYRNRLLPIMEVLVKCLANEA